VAPIDVIAYKGSELKVYSKRTLSILQYVKAFYSLVRERVLLMYSKRTHSIDIL
jgi:hypothetical protein